MKKFRLFFVFALVAGRVFAQNINPESDYLPGREPVIMSSVPHWCSGWAIDLNASRGFLRQGLSYNDPAANYSNPLNKNISDIEFEHGSLIGIDMQLGYFFGPRREFGIGTGLMYTHMEGNLTMDNFHIEYRSVDNFGNAFRQILTSNGQIKEKIGVSSFNIPLVFKYKTWFSKWVGFTGDAGLLFNLTERNHYNADASFDYEAIYKYTGSAGDIVPVYDNSPTPAASDVLITKSRYLATTPGGNINNYFNTLRSDGYNVGLGVKPNNTSGKTSYHSGSVGLLLRPAISISLTENLSMNFGVYYLYQKFDNDASSGYRITNKVGEYNSMLNRISSVSDNSFGVNVGVRYSFHNERCLHKERCIVVHRAPDAEETEAPQPLPVEVEEMPVASPVNMDDEVMEEVHMDISTPIYFELNSTDIRPDAYPILDEVVRELNNNKKATLEIHGYSDNKGPAAYNVVLSKLRAMAVKDYLRSKGIKPRLLKTIGHGSKNPAETNSTAEGRAQNRRVVLKLKEGK